jgi:hypothetical protein
MANSIDLNFDAKRAFGEYFPTVYLDFVEISYGTVDITDTDGTFTGEASFSSDPNSGTHLNGSFSIYFTREATESQAKENLTTWLIENLDELYLYSWISGWKSINEKVKKSSLDLRELFYSMEPATAADFDSDHPAFSLIIEEMKNAFFTGTQDGTDAFRSRDQMHWTGISWIRSGEETPDLSTIMATIDIPRSWAYKRFWGNPGSTGPWPHVTVSSDTIEDIDENGSIIFNELFAAGIGFMERYLYWTLASYQTHGGGYSEVQGQKFSAIKLSDWVKADGSNVKVEGLYDSDGDEIGVIVNLPIGGVDGFMLSQEIIEKRFDDGEVYLIAAIGRNVLSDTEWSADSDSTGMLEDKFREMNSTLFNRNFGDITYEHILTGEGSDTSNMVIATKPEEIYVSAANGSPVDGKPIMSIDGTYHDSNPMNQQIVVNTMNQILNKYGEYIDKSLSMKKNLSNLAYILGDKGEDIDLLRRLQTYRKTYMGKASGTSGKMYETFKKLLYSADQAVKKQSKLKKILVVNNKIIDSRLPTESVIYVENDHLGSGNGGILPGDEDATETRESGNYIPEVWAHMSRRSIKTVPIEGRNLLSEFSQYIFEEGTPTYTYEDTGETVYAGTGEYLGTDEESRSEWVDYYERFYRDRAVGAPTEMLEDAESFGFADVDGTTAISYFQPQYTDTVVENKGIFFFDYEKALQTQSKLSYVITPWMIERYLGLHVPYSYFRVKEVRLIREELKFETSMSEDDTFDLDGSLDETVTITQTLKLNDEKNYPVGDSTIYEGYLDNFRYGQPSVMLASSVTAANHADGEISPLADDDSAAQLASFSNYTGEGAAATTAGPIRATPSTPETSMIGTAATFTMEISAEAVVPEYSYLRFIHFDAPLGMRVDSDPYNYNSSPVPGLGYPSGRLQNFHSEKTRGGYRVMAFEYRDYMDDDVAYYNTVGREEFAHEGSLYVDGIPVDPASSLGHTKYKIEIDVEDTSLRMIDDIYYHLEENYNKFINNYYNLAIATCSFNNINDQFNEFFANGIKEEYPAYKDQEWIRAPYIFNMARNVFLGTFGTDSTGAQETTKMIENASRTARLIGPDDGRLMHLNRFKIDYEKLINIIKPRVGSPTTATSGQRLFGSLEAAEPTGDGFSGPVYTSHPVYERVLTVAAMGSGDVDHGASWLDDAAVTNFWSEAIDHPDIYTFTNSDDGWEIDEPIYGDMFLSALHAWDYTPEDVSINYEEMFKFIRLIPGLREQVWDGATDGSGTAWRGLIEIPNTLEYGWHGGSGGGFRIHGEIMYPPTHRDEDSDTWMTESIWTGWVDQLIFFAFVNKYHSVLEDAYALEPYHISDRTWAQIQEFIETMLARADEDSSAYGAGLERLQSGWSLATTTIGENHGANHSRLLRNRDNIWTPAGIEAIATIMNPRIYYSVQEVPGMSAAPDFHRPIIEYTHMKYADAEFKVSAWKDDNYGSSAATGYGTIRLITTGEEAYVTTSTGYNSSPGRIGFISRNHTADTTSAMRAKYTAYPGNFAPQNVTTGLTW